MILSECNYPIRWTKDTHVHLNTEVFVCVSAEHCAALCTWARCRCEAPQRRPCQRLQRAFRGDHFEVMLPWGELKSPIPLCSLFALILNCAPPDPLYPTPSPTSTSAFALHFPFHHMRHIKLCPQREKARERGRAQEDNPPLPSLLHAFIYFYKAKSLGVVV